MKDRSLATRAAGAVLLAASIRTLFSGIVAEPADLADPVRGAEAVLPDLQHDGWLRLSWLPGLGPERARQVVAARARLSVRLTPERLALLPGVGERTAAEIAAWYRRGGRGPPARPG
ncbi:MAG: hypothetical protein D6702_04650 [Planctomycetota bacterium]|nr:MAG: hypothetical protein D6702_04650 [Planctomycetota bacterium]